jgi:hypothetical protein
MNDIQIWKIGDCDWIAASNVEDAKRCLGEMIGEEDLERAVEDDCYAIADADLDKLTVSEDEDDLEGSKVTFRESLERMKKEGKPFPRHFCASEP